MTTANGPLDDLRREVDEIDRAMHELLMRRAALAERIGAAKETSARADGAAADYLRPAREAAVLRGLIARHSGSFPLPSLVRLWREIMSSLLRLQGPFSAAVFMAGGQGGSNWPGLWDLARDHYGSGTPLIPCQSAMHVLREVTEGEATVGLLPYPEEGEAMPWWPLVANTRASEPKIIARLPFVAAAPGGPGRGAVSALVVARLTPEETGDDRSLLMLEIAEDVSRARFMAALAAVGLPSRWQVAGPEQAGAGSRLHLVEIEGFVTSDDPRLAKFTDALGAVLFRIAVLGAYASPLTLDEPQRTLGAASAAR